MSNCKNKDNKAKNVKFYYDSAPHSCKLTSNIIYFDTKRIENDKKDSITFGIIIITFDQESIKVPHIFYI